VGIDFFARLAGGELQPRDIDDDAVRDVQQMIDAMVVRTRYFDQFFTQAADAGARQAVILASGLDSCAYRCGGRREQRCSRSTSQRSSSSRR